jgi:hypothetical protein
MLEEQVAGLRSVLIDLGHRDIAEKIAPKEDDA